MARLPKKKRHLPRSAVAVDDERERRRAGRLLAAGGRARSPPHIREAETCIGGGGGGGGGEEGSHRRDKARLGRRGSHAWTRTSPLESLGLELLVRGGAEGARWRRRWRARPRASRRAGGAIEERLRSVDSVRSWWEENERIWRFSARHCSFINAAAHVSHVSSVDATAFDDDDRRALPVFYLVVRSDVALPFRLPLAAPRRRAGRSRSRPRVPPSTLSRSMASSLAPLASVPAARAPWSPRRPSRTRTWTTRRNRTRERRSRRAPPPTALLRRPFDGAFGLLVSARSSAGP